MALKIKGKVVKSVSTYAEDGEILDALGLLQKFHTINVLAQSEGYGDGGVEVKWVNGIANQMEITITLADKVAELTVPSEDFQSILQSQSMGVELEEGTDAYDLAMELKETISSFLATVMSDIVSKEESPTMQLIAKTAFKKEGTLVGKFTDTVESDIPVEIVSVVHTCTNLECDPEIGAKNLDNATRLYEPVYGTSNGSRYHCILITKQGVKVAARFKQNTLSLKVIVPSGYKKLTELTSELGSMGLSLKEGGHYSCHYSGVNKQLAQRTLGALVACFDPQDILTGLPVLTKFVDHGI
ncbi:transporter [Vibrio phage V-YDF132]|nr:transporter [Vibrio phage V-YDF132]